MRICKVILASGPRKQLQQRASVRSTASDSQTQQHNQRQPSCLFIKTSGFLWQLLYDIFQLLITIQKYSPFWHTVLTTHDTTPCLAKYSQLIHHRLIHATSSALSTVYFLSLMGQICDIFMNNSSYWVNVSLGYFYSIYKHLFDLEKQDFSQNATCSHRLGTNGWWRRSVNIENDLKSSLM